MGKEQRMSAQDKTEKVLRSLHVLLSKSEPYGTDPNKIIVEKQKVLELLSSLNQCIYEIMEEYELTKQSRDRAEREFKKQGDGIVWDASRKAEDIYAASVMYTDEALNYVQDIMKSAAASVQAVYEELGQKLKEEVQVVHTNQMELKSQLQDMVDTEKYLKLIEERNKEIAKEKAKKDKEEAAGPEPSIYANRQTEVRINEEYLRRMGLSLEEQLEKEEKVQPEVEIKVDRNAEFFRRKKGK